MLRINKAQINKLMTKKSGNGQTIIEFCFTMLVVLLMIYSLMHIFRWTGRDLAERRKAHDNALFTDVNNEYFNPDGSDGPLKQIDPKFYNPIGMNAIWTPN